MAAQRCQEGGAEQTSQTMIFKHRDLAVAKSSVFRVGGSAWEINIDTKRSQCKQINSSMRSTTSIMYQCLRSYTFYKGLMGVGGPPSQRGPACFGATVPAHVDNTNFAKHNGWFCFGKTLAFKHGRGVPPYRNLTLAEAFDNPRIQTL